MSDLFEGEEVFVLQPSQPPPSTAAPFVHEGWNDVEPVAPLPETPPRFSALRQAIRQKIVALQAARKKAPSSRIARLARMLSALRQRWMRSLMGGVQWAVGAVSGGRRKRVAELDCESVDSDHQAKRVRMDDGQDDAMEAEGEGQLEDEDDDFVDVPVPDFGAYREFDYGQAEDRAATKVILAADFDVNVDNAHPEEEFGDEVQIAVDEAPILPPVIEMEVDEEPIAMADVPIHEVEVAVEAPVIEADQPAPARRSLPRRAKAPAPAKAPPLRKPAPKRKGGRRRRQDPLEVLETARGRGFIIERRFNGTARLTGSFPGVDCSKSALLHKAAHGGVTITAPPRTRIIQVVAGATHVMLLTNKGRIMMIGSNAQGQLGCRGKTQKTRAASLSLGWMQRGPIGMAAIPINSIKAVGHASYAWDTANQAYRCGATRRWRAPIFERCPGMDK